MYFGVKSGALPDVETHSFIAKILYFTDRVNKRGYSIHGRWDGLFLFVFMRLLCVEHGGKGLYKIQ